MHTRPTRSALYIPGSKDRALEKARNLPVDVILFDLEDAVAPDAKIAARDTLFAALAGGGYGPRQRIVRINGLDTQWGRADAAAVAAMDCDAILLPKVNSTADVDALAALVPRPADLGDDGNAAICAERGPHRRASAHGGLRDWHQ